MVSVPPSWRTRSGRPSSSDSSRGGRSSPPTTLTAPATSATPTRSSESKVSLSGSPSIQPAMVSLHDISRSSRYKIYRECRLSRGVVSAHRLDRVGLLGPLVGAVAQDPGEAQGHPARVAGAGLDAVEGDLHHQLRANVDDVAVGRADGQLQQALGLPGEQ